MNQSPYQIYAVKVNIIYLFFLSNQQILNRLSSMSYYTRYQGSNYGYDNSYSPSPVHLGKNGSTTINEPSVYQDSKYTGATVSNNLVKKDDKKLNLVPTGANRISAATTNYSEQLNKVNKTKEKKIEQFKYQTKEADENKAQNLNWLTHTFICLSTSESTGKKKIQKIYQIIKTNQKNFSKAIIYADTAYSSRQIYNYFDNKFRKDVKIINTSHSQQQARNIYMQFILPQFKILITTHQPKQLNEEAMIDIEDVNLIIFQVLPTSPADYQSRLIRSPKLNEGAKGIVVSFTSQTYSYTLYKYVPNVQQHQKNLNIKFEEFKGNVSPFIKKGIQKTNSPQKKDNYLKKQEKNQYLLQQLNSREKTRDKNLFRIEDVKKQEINLRPASRKNDSTKKNQVGISLISRMERQPEDESVNHIKQLGKNAGMKLNNEKQQEIRQKTKEKYGQKYVESQESDVAKTRLGGTKALEKDQRQKTVNIKMQKIQEQSEIKSSGMKKEQTQKLLKKFSKVDEYFEKQGEDFKKYLNVTDQIKKNTQNVKQIPEQTAKLLQKQMKSLENNIGNKIDHYSKQFSEVKKQMESNAPPKHLLQKLISLIEKTGSQSKEGNKQILKHLIRVEENQNSLASKANSNSPENTKQIRKLKQQNELKDRELKKQKDQYQYKIAELQKNQNSSRIISSYSRANPSFQQFLRDFNSIIRQCLNFNSAITTSNYKTELPKVKAVLQKNNKYLQQVESLINSINKVLDEHSITLITHKLDNYKAPLQELSRKLSQKNIVYNSMSNSKNSNQNSFLCESNLYESFTDIQKQFLFQAVKGILGRKEIKKTKTLFELDKNEQNDYHGWLLKIKKKPNLLMLVVLDNDQVLASFTQNYFTFKYEDQGRYGDGAIMNLTTLKRYNLKEKGKGVRSDDYIFGLGNNEVLIKPNFKLGVIISRAYNVYNTANVTNKQFYGYEDDECGYKKLEFHQVLTK